MARRNEIAGLVNPALTRGLLVLDGGLLVLDGRLQALYPGWFEAIVPCRRLGTFVPNRLLPVKPQTLLAADLLAAYLCNRRYYVLVLTMDSKRSRSCLLAAPWSEAMCLRRPRLRICSPARGGSARSS